jgi:predicted transcriptional regulator
MKSLTEYQVINDTNGNPAFVFIPYDVFINSKEGISNGIPKAVERKTDKGMTMLQAWREYLKLSQREMADRMGITPAGYGQIEAATRPRRATLEKAATALGISIDQLDY